jgi:sugar lactone lactonase YvrE
VLVAAAGCGRVSFEARAVDGVDAAVGDPPAGVYYADNGFVFRIDFATGARTTVVSTLGYPNGLAFDAARRTLYVSDDGPDEIHACDAEGGFVPRFVYAAGTRVEGLTLDAAGTTIYYAAKQVGEVWAVGVDGTSPRLVMSGIPDPDGVAFDAIGGWVYVTSPTDGFIVRSRPDGTDVQMVVTGLVSPEGIVLDGAGRLFVVDEATVRRVDLDGGNPQVVVRGVEGGEGIALDLVHGHMYWSDSGMFDVWRANLDGTSATSIETGLVGPEDVAVGP